MKKAYIAFTGAILHLPKFQMLSLPGAALRRPAHCQPEWAPGQAVTVMRSRNLLNSAKQCQTLHFAAAGGSALAPGRDPRPMPSAPLWLPVTETRTRPANPAIDAAEPVLALQVAHAAPAAPAADAGPGWQPSADRDIALIARLCC